MLPGVVAVLLMLVGWLPATAETIGSDGSIDNSGGGTGSVMFLADNAGNTGTQRDPCGQIVDPTQSKATADARPYLPLARWSDVASGLHDRLDADFWEDIYSKIQRRLMFSNMLAAGNALWNVSANMASSATVFCPLQEAGRQADEVAASFAAAVRGTPILTGVFVAVLLAAFWQAYRRRSAGAAAKALARPVLVMALIMVMAIGASASTDSIPGTGSPWWFASKLNSAVNTIAGSLTNSFASTSPSGQLADGLLTDPNSNLTCSKMLDELHNQYAGTYGSVRVQQLSAAVPLTLSKMWEQTGLTAWARVQFGQAADNANTARVFCRLLESRLGMTDTGTELRLSQLSGAGLPAPGPAVFSGLNADDRQVDQTMIAWAACDWDGHQFTVPVTSPNNWSGFSLGGDSGGGGSTDSGTGPATPDACQKWWTAQDYDTSGLDQTFNLEDDPQFIGAEAAETGQTGIQDFLLSWHGNITSDAMITSGTYGLSSLVMLFVYGGMSLGIIIAKVAMMVMLALVFLAAFLSLWVGGTGRSSRLAQFAKYFVGLVVFVFGITVMFNLINLVSLFMTSIGTGIFSQGSFMAIVWAGFSPVIAVIVLHLLFKHLLRTPSPFKPSGALAWAGAIGGIGAAAAVGFDRLSYRGRSYLSDFAGGAWRRGRRPGRAGPQEQSDSKGQTRGASAAVNEPDSQFAPAAQPGEPGNGGRGPDGQTSGGTQESADVGAGGPGTGSGEGLDVDAAGATPAEASEHEDGRTSDVGTEAVPAANGEQAQAPTESTAAPEVTSAAAAARARAARRQQVRDRAATVGKAIWRHKGKIAVGTVLAMPVLGLPALSVVGAVSAAGTAVGAAGSLAGAVGGAAAASPFTAVVASASLAMARRHIRDRRSMAQAANAGPMPQVPHPPPAGDRPATPSAAPGGGTHPDAANNERTAEPGTGRPEGGKPPAPSGQRGGNGGTDCDNLASGHHFHGGESPTPRRRSDSEEGAYTFPDLDQTGPDGAGER